MISFIKKTKEFFGEVYSQLKKVSWLSRREILTYTIIVIMATLIFSLFLGGLDYIFSTILKQFIF